jgi:beta-xylosidase
MAITDEGGARYLVWKEDGNSRNQATPMWAQRLSDDGLKLLGKKVELIRNDPRSWEGGVVEGAFILRRGKWFYLFYSGNACCGRRCNYALGVARSSELLGPYEKYVGNPILAENENWQCPGHGSIVTDGSGRDFLLYHAYRKSETGFFIGREALLDQITWDSNGWPKINEGRGPSGQRSRAADGPEYSVFDSFDGPQLGNNWQWPQLKQPLMKLDLNGWLTLAPTGAQATDELAAVVSHPVNSPNFIATTVVDVSTMQPLTVAGLSAYQGSDSAVGITIGGGKVWTYLRDGKKHQIVSRENAVNTSKVYLRMTAVDGARFRFAFSQDGQTWRNCGEEIHAGHLETVRIALTVGGFKGAAAKFDWFRVTPL